MPLGPPLKEKKDTSGSSPRGTNSGGQADLSGKRISGHLRPHANLIHHHDDNTNTQRTSQTQHQATSQDTRTKRTQPTSRKHPHSQKHTHTHSPAKATTEHHLSQPASQASPLHAEAQTHEPEQVHVAPTLEYVLLAIVGHLGGKPFLFFSREAFAKEYPAQMDASLHPAPSERKASG